MADGTETIWEKLDPASFEVDGEGKVVFAVHKELVNEGGLREVARAVPFVDGEQLDETGLTSDTFQVEAFFHNDLNQFEDRYGNEPPAYPDRLEALIDLFRTKKTGTLHLLMQRNIRCKAIRWARVASGDALDCETLRVTFKFDNEARLDSPRAEKAGVHVSLNGAVEQAVFDAQRAGAWGGSWEDLTELASQLSTAMQAPATFLGDVAQKAARLSAACDQLLFGFQSLEDGRDIFLDPTGQRAFEAVFNLGIMANRAESEARSSGPKIITKRYPLPTSLFEIAVAEKVDIVTLLDLNPQIEDPSYIPAGTPVKIPAPTL